MSLASLLKTYKIPYSNPVRKPTQHNQLPASHSSIHKALLRFSRFLKGSKALTRHNSIRNLCQRKSKREVATYRILLPDPIHDSTKLQTQKLHVLGYRSRRFFFFYAERFHEKTSCESTPIMITLGFYSLPTTTQETQHAKH
jgi:hypothetical protein